MHVLGISCYFHDAAAALVSDGVLVAAAEEERFSRIKHDFNFPDRAIRFCLGEGGLSGRDLDCVVFFEKPFLKFERILSTALATAPRSGAVFRQAMTAWLLDKLWVKNRISEVASASRRSHSVHRRITSHTPPARSSARRSSVAAILTVDGVGEWTTTALGVGEGSTCRLLDEVRFPHSLGLFYSAFTAFLGFEVNEGEYKVMGMAPYGTPRYADKVRSVIRQSADGAFELDLDYFTFHHSTTRTYSDKFVELFGAPRAPETPFFTKTQRLPAVPRRAARQFRFARSREPALRRHRRERAGGYRGAGAATRPGRLAGELDLALHGRRRGAQQRRQRTDTARGRLERLYVQPAAGDGGAAVGAALYGSRVLLSEPARFVMDHAYWGQAHNASASTLRSSRSGLRQSWATTRSAMIA